MIPLKNYRDNHQGFSDLLNYAAMVDDGIILNKDGSLTAAFSYRGQDISSSTPDERNYIAMKMNQALASLGTGYMTHTDAIRTQVSAYSKAEQSHFPHNVFKLIDESRRYYFEEGERKFQSQYVITVTYMPPSKNLSKITELVYDHGNVQRTSPAQRNLERFKNKMIELQGRLEGFLHIKRLKAYRHDGQWRDALLEHINHTILGQKHPITLPHTPMYLDAYLGNYDFWTGLKPKLDNQYICCISIDGFPNFSHPNILNVLDYLNVEYRWSSRFCHFDSSEAIKLLKKEQNKWKQKVVSFKDKLLRNANPQIDEDALDMVNQYDAAITSASKGDIQYGHYTSTIVLRSANIEQLELDAEEVAKCLRNTMGFSCRIETVNSIEAFLGSLPSDALHNVRKPLISTMNLSHMIPMAGIWTGAAHCPCPFYPEASPPLMYCSAEGNTPFRFNLHVKDVGHSLIFGPTGSGKSTLLAMIAAQFTRYQGASLFAFDKGNSMYTISQCGGSHFDIGGDNSTLSFAPLADLDNDFEWCEQYLEQLLVLQGVNVVPAMRQKIHSALNVMKGDGGIKTLSEFVTQVQDDAIKQALQYYTHGNRCGDLLDAEEETFTLSHLQVFEIESLMNRGDKDLIPVLMYLFRKIERNLTGQPAMIIIDEAWIALSHPVFRDMIKEWLKVLRKANCMVVMATQSLSDAIKSGMLDVLIESCPTQIFLPNPKAHQFADIYAQFGLNTRQIDIIKNSRQKRQYYMFTPEGSRLIDLSLNALALAFVGVSDKEELAEVKALVSELDENWYWQWLKQKGVMPQ
ncbi:conjugal transfer protein TrbE [Vibrio parahaemolyticus]|uniref:VirB4 family type IV secretion/conjugal transfer ATPase n=1 Tax=Vibrio parahaemolyticus TaxID=670 RepID=UPI00084B0AF9|nr:conjugal transfer protein TrbE [Vibrio parahaemolyticus]OEB90886.1 conjugal transfer protein TrbE [Vibrio parahaemolyticus]